MTEWVLRQMRDSDRDYVLSSWLRSYAEIARRHRLQDKVTREVIDPGGEFRTLDRETFFKLYEPVVQRIVDRSAVVIATLPGDHDVILGWMAIELDVMHYVLTKPRWRKLGVAKWLLGHVRELRAFYTHEPKPALVQRLIPEGWTYDGLRRFERKAA